MTLSCICCLSGVLFRWEAFQPLGDSLAFQPRPPWLPSNLHCGLCCEYKQFADSSMTVQFVSSPEITCWSWTCLGLASLQHYVGCHTKIILHIQSEAQLLMFNLSPSSDLLWVSLSYSLSTCSRLLWWGGEADGFCVWTPRLQGPRSRDTHPPRAHVPRGPPHVAPAGPAARTSKHNAKETEYPSCATGENYSAFPTAMKVFVADLATDCHFGAELTDSRVRPSICTWFWTQLFVVKSVKSSCCEVPMPCRLATLLKTKTKQSWPCAE